MPRVRYIDKKFNNVQLRIITLADQICREYQAQGYDLTLRQLYYQFVARGYLENSAASYAKLGKIVSDARMAGYLDWDFITDRIRNLRSLSHWEKAEDLIEAAGRSFRMDKWKEQPTRMECWVEKDALMGVLEAVCPGNDVPYFSCRGYNSQSEQWAASQRIRAYVLGGQKVVVLYLGDHDPSGVDMTRDIRKRLTLFLATDLYQQEGFSRANAVTTARDALEVRRVALNMEQVDEFNPPPNFAKPKDSRFKKYVEEFGEECWELDALPPNILVGLIQDEIDREKDHRAWEESVRIEQLEKDDIAAVAANWDAAVMAVSE